MVIDISKITLENIDKYNKNEIKRCPVCNKEFEITYRKQECCSKKCYYKNNRNRKKLKESSHDN